jgi:hypothetical protein
MHAHVCSTWKDFGADARVRMTSGEDSRDSQNDAGFPEFRMCEARLGVHMNLGKSSHRQA